MGLRTPEEYVDSLRRQHPEVWVRGERVESVADYPLFASTLACWGTWLCRAAQQPELAGTMIASPDLNGEECHVFWHMATSADDLTKNLWAARYLSERSPLSGYASIGRDELQALLIVSHDVDRDRGTGYHERVVEYVKRFQREQLMTAAAVTDVKGDRSRRPADQDDPDLYLHVVDRSADGIVVRGAKAHTSGSVVSNELVVIPQRALREQDADYAVAFAVPIDTPGLKLVCRGFSGEERDEFEAPVSCHDDLMESFTIFDDVFVPWERVFLCGEWEYAGDVANTFANVNRQGYLGADVGKLRLFIGAARLVSELNGVANVPHIQDKITEMIRLERAVWALGLAASLESHTREPGFQVPDPVLTNAGKHMCMEGHYMAARNLLEIAGGSVMTAPYVEDIMHPELRPFVEKYYRGVDPDGAIERLRVMKLIHDLAASEYGGYWYTEIIHGSGSPAAEKIQMFREHDTQACVELARAALGGRTAIGERQPQPV
ncbi:MAG TPA: 4-hydroxyphenylacetate 3-hydroxylase N-terminal domain-containing protein [Gaiellaceae bacterium]|jgi:4-hydroxybutyryl-CoA dehydratase/vinylacetyl-CoA-Delta-isomerase